MAILSLRVDTETNEYFVEVDGEAVENVGEVRVDNYGTADKDMLTFSIETREVNGTVTKMTRLVASNHPDAPEGAKAGLVEVGGMTKAQKAFVEMWNNRRKVV